MTRYKLPDELGGGEHEEYRHVGGTTEAPAGTVAFLLDGCIFTVALALLTQVKPPLPEEPADGVPFRIGTNGPIFMRHDAAACGCIDEGPRYLRMGHGELSTWEYVSGLGTPTLLLPAPGPVDLPWSYTDDDGDRLKIDSSGYREDTFPAFVRSGARDGVYLSEAATVAAIGALTATLDEFRARKS